MATGKPKQKKRWWPEERAQELIAGHLSGNREMSDELSTLMYALAWQHLDIFRNKAALERGVGGDHEDAVQIAVIRCLDKCHLYRPSAGPSYPYFTTVCLSTYSDAVRTGLSRWRWSGTILSLCEGHKGGSAADGDVSPIDIAEGECNRRSRLHLLDARLRKNLVNGWRRRNPGRLTPEEVNDIRARAKAGQAPVDISIVVQRSKHVVYGILRGRSYSHVIYEEPASK